MQEQILLACTICSNRWYSSTKNKKKIPEKLALNKYCKFCRKKTVHKEVK